MSMTTYVVINWAIIHLENILPPVLHQVATNAGDELSSIRVCHVILQWEFDQIQGPVSMLRQSLVVW